MNEQFDATIIGTGAGGGMLLHRLAASGKRILPAAREGQLELSRLVHV